MAKRESAYERKIKKEIAIGRAKHTREWKKKEFDAAMVKKRVETISDIVGIYCGLSIKARERAIFRRIQELAGRGFSPAEIVQTMEPKKKDRVNDEA